MSKNFMSNSNAVSVLTEFATAIKNRVISSMIASKESSSTASKNYSSGDYLILNDVLYKVIDDIPEGYMIVTTGVNANVEPTNVTGELKNKQEDIGLLVKNGKLCVRYTVEEE